jgi:division protein 1
MPAIYTFLYFIVEGVKERLEYEESSSRHPTAKTKAPAQFNHIHQSSRRRKGPAFLPSEHDELPPGVAFMVINFACCIFGH